VKLLPAILVAVLIGTLLPLQGLVNARLSASIGGPVAAAFVSFLVGTLALGLYIVATRTPLAPAAALHLPAWVWVGGALGAIYVACFTLIIPHLGAASIICMAVLGQIIASLLLDHFGVLQAPRPADWTRLLGVMLMLAGVALVVAPWQAPPAKPAAAAPQDSAADSAAAQSS
jgi:transporter family-2 protein